MKKHTTHFKNKIKEFGRQLDSKITYELNGETIELGNEKLNSITPTFQSKILKSAMKQLDIDSNEDIPLNTEINYKFGTLIDNEYEYIDYGNYIVYSSEKQEDTDSYKIVCYDKMLYSMINYEGLRNGSFPMTVKEFLQNICKDLYLDFKDSNFANQDRIIEIDLYKDLGYTYRDVLDELSEVTASTICMNNNDELEVRYIEYASYDKEVTGETITINDNELDKAKSLIISGNLEQQTYSGKNLWKLAQSGVKNGITYTNNGNDTFNLSGTATSQASFNCIIPLIDSKLITNKDYTISCTQTIGTNLRFYVHSCNETGQWSKTLMGFATNVHTYKLPSPTTNYINFQIVVPTGVTINMQNVKVQLEEGTQATPYEPYVGGIPSPNPGYPQEIDVVEGVRNLFDKDNVKKGYIIDSNGNESKNDNLFSSNYIKIKPNTTYTFSYKSNDYSWAMRYAEYNENKIFIERKIASYSPYTFTTNSTTEYLRISGYINDDNWQLEEGTISHSYVPYGSNYLINKITGKNLFDKDNYNEIGVFFNQYTTVLTSSTLSKSIYIPIVGGKKYIIEKEEGTRFNVCTTATIPQSNTNIIDNAKNMIDNTQLNPINITLETSLTAKYLVVWYYASNSDTKTQKELRDSIKIYDADKQTIINYDLQNNYLAKIGDNIDTLDEVSGELNKKIGKYIFTGNEPWAAATTAVSGKYRYYLPNVLNYIPNVKFPNQHYLSKNMLFCNYLTAYSGGNNNPYNNVTGIGFTMGNLQQLGVYIEQYSSSSASFKQWLKQQYDNGTPVIIYYILETPETIQLTPTKITLNKGTNNLSLESNIPTQMTLKYTNEIDSINEEYLKDVNVNFGEKYGPVNSIVLSRAAESDNVYIQDEESIEKNGLTELKIIDNQIMNFNDRSDYLPELLERLDGLEYYLNDFSSTGICYYDICDKYRIKVFDNTYECVMFNDEVNITQGLEENVYTELPEETETDYTKADKTDQRINQTYLIVDKQNQKIESLASQVIDLTREANGIRYLEINDAYPSDIITLKIKGKFSLLFPSETLFPDDDLFMTDSNLIIGTKLPRGELYPSNDLHPSNALHINYDGTLIHLPVSKLEEDEILIIDNNDCYIEKDDGTITHYGEVYIPLNENDNYIYLQDFYNSPIDYYGKYAIKSEYTTVFTTKVEMNASIKQTADAINLEVSKKVDSGEVISTINQTAEKIDIKGNRIEIESEYFHLDDDGTIKSTGGTIGGFNIDAYTISSYVSSGLEFVQDDITRVMNIISGTVTPTQEDYDKYDLNKDGKIDRFDLLKIQSIVFGFTLTDGEVILNSQDSDETLAFKDSNGVTKTFVGLNGITSNYITGSNISATNITTDNLTVNGNFINNSDARLKKDIEILDDKYENLVKEINPVSFTYKENNLRQIGFIAQEMKEIFDKYEIEDIPVKKDELGFYSINYINLIGILWKDNQILHEEINKLKEMINNG